MVTMADSHQGPPKGESSEVTSEDSLASNEDDVYAQLVQKERDLFLAAELGKALLESNQELQLRYDHAMDDFTHKIEDLKQEKHDLHLELEKMETEYQNALKDLQDDVVSLRLQLKAKDDFKISERERSRSLREAQINSDYYMDEIKKASKREEELVIELSEQREKLESNAATIKDQMDHIAMLRDQVEYLSEKLKKANQKLTEVQGQKEVLMNTFELTHEDIQGLELKIAQQEEKIHRQAYDIEELQEANSDLQLQLDHQQQLPYYRPHHRKSAPSSVIGTKNKNNIGSARGPQPNTLFQELTQEKQKQNQNNPESTGASMSSDKCLDEGGQTMTALDSESTQSANINNNAQPLSVVLPISAEFAQCHSRNASNCSLSSLTEGSRKRHHQNIGSSSDDDSEADRNKTNRNFGCKQTVYSDSSHSYQLAFSSKSCLSESTLDNNGNGVLLVESSNLSNKEMSASNSAELLQTSDSAFDEHDILSESSSKCTTPEEFSRPLECNLETYQDNRVMKSDSSHRVGLHRETSLFTELSSQMLDDKTGSGSDTSSNCMLGVFDFYSGPDSISHDVDRQSSESLNQSMEMTSRLASDMSMTSEWYYMTPVTSEMLEDDDFECDDDDFLVGNIAGSTLSIGDSRNGLSYNYHFTETTGGDEATTQHSLDEREIVDCVESKECSQEKQQQQLTEACLQLRDLVVRLQGHCDINLKPQTVTTEDLLSLVAQMRICVDNITDRKIGRELVDVNTTASTELYETDQLNQNLPCPKMACH